MKKTLIAMCACLAAGSMSAQWHSDPTKSNLLISGETETSASLVQAKETPDGKFWVTWLSWQDGMNGYIKAQLLDKDGTPLLDEGGIFIMKQTTATWTSNYGMNVTPDGCLVVCHSDSRHDTEARQEFTPYAYKIDQEGNHLWGLNGIEFPTTDRSGHRPKVGVTNDGTVIIGFNDLAKGGSEAAGFVMYKINEDGTLAWSNPLVLGGMFGAFEACDEDDLFVSLIGNGAIQLYRIDSLGDPVWEEPVIVEDRDPNTRSEIQPVSDEIGGVVMPYQRYINLSVSYSGIQRITPDGETCMGLRGIDLSEEPGQHSFPGISLNGKRQEMVVAWNMGGGAENYILVQKYDYSGVPQWDEPLMLGGDYIWGYATTHAKMLDDGSAIICYDDKHSALKSDLKIMKVDADGKVLWTKQMTPQAYRDEPVLFFDEEKGEGYIFLTDNRKDNGPSPSGAIYGQNFKLVDDSEVSVAAVGSDADLTVRCLQGVVYIQSAAEGVAELYDTTGALVATKTIQAGETSFAPEVASGLYIVRVKCGDAFKAKKVRL